MIVMLILVLLLFFLGLLDVYQVARGRSQVEVVGLPEVIQQFLLRIFRSYDNALLMH